jgi:plastocyanin
MRKAFDVLVVVLVAGLLTAACASEPEEATGGTAGGGGGAAVRAGEGGNRVVASDFSFRPQVLELQPGEKAEVTFVNEDGTTHSFTSEELEVDVEAEGGTSASVSLTAPEAGTAEFHCRFHSQMTGEIAVGKGGAKGSEDASEGGQTESEDDGGGY